MYVSIQMMLILPTKWHLLLAKLYATSLGGSRRELRLVKAKVIGMWLGSMLIHLLEPPKWITRQWILSVKYDTTVSIRIKIINYNVWVFPWWSWTHLLSSTSYTTFLTMSTFFLSETLTLSVWFCLLKFSSVHGWKEEKNGSIDRLKHLHHQ